MPTIERWFATLVLAIAAGAAGRVWMVTELPVAERVARGVTLGAAVADGTERADEVVGRAVAVLDRSLSLVFAGKELLRVSLRELGARTDERALAERLMRVGRDGSFVARLVAAREARRGARAVALIFEVPLGPLAERLGNFKEQHDRKPVAARFDFATSRPTEHQDGELVDVDTTLALLVQEGLDLRSDGVVTLAVMRVLPAASIDAVAKIERSALVGRYVTRFEFVGHEAGRAQNIARAAAGIDGLVLMPQDRVSFNEAVGPRSEDNGFSQAGEIYKGEMRLGIGGGTCQVASSLYAAAFFGGLEIVERSPHSRPSGYIGLGLDATVAYPTVDLVLKNPFPFPIVVRARPEKGTLTIELWGRERGADVELRTATVGAMEFERKVERVPYLAAGRVLRKQAGRQGVTIEKTRHLRAIYGGERVETTRDVYPPTTEIYLLGPGADESTLPPFASTTERL